MRVAVHDGGAAGKRSHETRCASFSPTRVVHHPDPHGSRVDDQPLGQQRPQAGLVDVPVYCLQRCQAPQLLVCAGAREIAGVQNEVRTADQREAFRREPPPAARQVRVGEDGENYSDSARRPAKVANDGFFCPSAVINPDCQAESDGLSLSRNQVKRPMRGFALAMS